jgi:glycosyltransferase involved in cell wall biosynthesis
VQAAAADLFLNTNRIDNVPVSVIEAGAWGLPVVATRVGGIPFLLEHGKTALLVADDDAVGLAHAADRLLRHADLAETLSHNGRRLAEACDWPNLLPRWRAVIERAAATRVRASAA